MRSYNYLISDAGVDDRHYVELLETKLIELLHPLIAEVEVDEKWYLATYSDVASAIQRGELKSASEHYLRAGYFENRLPRPIKVDNKWYTKQYPDVLAAVSAGTFKDGQHHFELNGFKEGRLPSAGWTLLRQAKAQSANGAGQFG
jgi:hypothetical protein